MDPALLAGAVSTVIFAAANVPMLAKAVRTRELGSYSLPSLVTVNVGNVVHTAYVVSLPPGPIWVLHGFYLVAMLTMLALYLRYVHRRDRARVRAGGDPPAGERGASMNHA